MQIFGSLGVRIEACTTALSESGTHDRMTSRRFEKNLNSYRRVLRGIFGTALGGWRRVKHREDTDLM